MKEMQAFFDELAAQGRNGDTMIAHISPQEASLLKSLGGSGTTNPKTGLPEFWGISIPGTNIGVGSDYGGVSIGNTSTGDIADKAIGIVNDVVIDPVVDVVGDAYMAVRDPLEAAAVVVGNYYFPGSSIITSKLVSDGAKEQLNTPEFRIANLGAGAYGAYDGNFANYGFNSAGEAEAAYQADLEAVNPPELLGEAGGNTFALDSAQEGLIPLGDAASESAAQVTAAKAAMVEKGLTFSQAMNYVRGGLLINSLTGDPLGLGGGQPEQAPAGSTGFAQVDIPAEWKLPTYAAPSAPIDLSSIFSNQDMLGGTQWQGLSTQQPNVSFNDIFASGQQQTPMGTPVDLNQIVSSILGQAATSQKPA